MAEPNVVSVELDVRDEERATTAFKRLRDEHGRFVSETQSSAQTLSAAATQQEAGLTKVAVATQRAREEALKLQQTSQTGAEAAARAYIHTDAEVEKLRASLRATREEALALQSDLARQGNASGSRAAADLARRTGRGLESIDQDPSSVARVEAFSRGGAQRSLSALKDEAKGFNEEIAKSGNLLTSLNRRLPGLGSPIGSLVRGLFGGLLIVEAVRGVVELVDQYRELKRADEDARRQLIQSSVDTGANIRREVEQVNSLSESYHGLSRAILDSLQAEAQRANRVPVTEQTVEQASKNVDNEVTRSLRGLPDEAISRAALNAAIKRGLRDQETLDKSTPGFFASVIGSLIPSYRERTENRQPEATAAAARKALADLSAGNPQALTGLSDAEAQARFSSVIGKLPSEFTEEEKRLARLNALLQEQGAAYTTAADAAQTFAQQTGAANQSAGDDARQAAAGSRAAADQEAADALRRLEINKKYKETAKKHEEEFWKDVDEIDKRNEREAEERLRAYEQMRSALVSARDAAREFLSGALVKSDADNPMISLFIRLRTEVEETRKRFLTFGSDFADMMANIKRAEIEQEIAVARLQSRLEGLRAEQEARRLERPQTGLTGPEERALAVFDARINAVTAGTQGALMAQALLAGQTRVDPATLAGRQFAGLQQLEKQLGNVPGSRDALDSAYKSLFSSLPDDAKKEVARTGGVRDVFAGAFSRDAGRAQREIADAVAREQAGTAIQEDARELVRAIKDARGVPDATRLRELLAVTGSLSDKELAPDLRQSRVEALRATARADAGREGDAERRAQKLEGFVDRLTAAIEGRGFKVDMPPIGINLNVADGLQVDRAQVGESPTAEAGGSRW